MLRLGNCFDLLDPENVLSLKALHDAMLKQWSRTGAKIPKNGNQHKNLDCAIFNYLYKQADGSPQPIDSARAVYVSTEANKRIWTRSWIYEEAHIQLCVRS